MWSYLEHSADDAHIRAQLEHLLAQVPASHRQELITRLRDSDDRRVKDALSELVVHQGLVEIGRTDIQVAPVTSGGATDYCLTELGLHLEVTRLGERDDAHGDRQRRYQVIDGLNKVDFGRFALHGSFTAGQQAPPVRNVRDELLSWLDGLDATAERRALEASPAGYRPPEQRFSFGDWTLDVIARPLRADAPNEPLMARLVHPQTRGSITMASIRKALKKKKKQHRDLRDPLLIVLDVSASRVPDRLLADALYGAHSVARADRLDTRALWPTPQAPATSAKLRSTQHSVDVTGVLVLDHLHVTQLETIEATLWLPPHIASSALQGPWRIARLIPSAGDDLELSIENIEGGKKYFLVHSS
jgi:hypothetical protein